MSIVFVRRRNLGRGSIKGMQEHLSQTYIQSSVIRTWHPFERPQGISSDYLVVRWGCTTTLPPAIGTAVVLNTPQAIHRVNEKKEFRMLLQSQNPNLVPTTITALGTSTTFPLVVRSARHAQGRNLWVAHTEEELKSLVAPLENWYASTLVEKAAEYRIYVVGGRVATVAEKTPQDASQVAWNVAQGGRFDVVRWGDWPMEVIKVAIEAFRHSGLDFGGVDVMVEKETGKPYILEINSAPSLPHLSGGRVSYRQKCMANCLAYIHEHGKDWIEPQGYHSWRQVIHPACTVSQTAVHT